MFILMILSSIFVSSAYADVNDKKRYLILFKQAELGESKSSLQNLIENGVDTSQTMSSGTAEAKQAIADNLNLDGEVIIIWDGINGVMVNIDQTEVDRLSTLEQVKSIEEDMLMTPDVMEKPLIEKGEEENGEEETRTLITKKNAGWGLARLHQGTATSDNSYQYKYDGSGRTIYVLDSGLNINNPKVAAEFGSRASILSDVNFAGKGEDCTGHGTMVIGAPSYLMKHLGLLSPNIHSHTERIG